MAATLKEAAAPGLTVWLAGCVVMDGADNGGQRGASPSTQFEAPSVLSQHSHRRHP